MTEFSLRSAHAVEAVDPLLVSPNPREMGQMYVNLREVYPDGMTLACAEPREPYTYNEVVEEYSRRCDDPEFSDMDFFMQYFTVPQLDKTSHSAEPGQTLDEYISTKLPDFMVSATNRGYFDVTLPEDRAVAGVGRFGGQAYHWDSFLIAQGYAAEGRWDLIEKIVLNTEYEINKYGHPLNGSAEFYATRAQPDYFGHMVRMMADKVGPEALVRFLPALEKDHMGYWMDGIDELSALPDDGEAHAHRTLVRMPDGSFLNRYWDDGEGPRLESYWEDVETAKAAIEGLTGEARETKTRDVYKDLRAAAASGWDFSSRWFEDGSTLSTINTTKIAPIDLNSLLAYNEETLAMSYMAAAELDAEGYNKDECLERAAKYYEMSQQRIEAINTYLWDPTDEIYRDYNFVANRQTTIVSAAMTYPLYTGIAYGKEQVFGVARALKNDLLYSGGIIVTTTEDSEEQWDGGSREGTRSKNVWAPPQYATVRGLADAARKLMTLETEIDVEPLFDLAEEARDNFIKGIQTAFDTNGSVPEKLRGDDPGTPATGGEYDLVSLLGMTVGTWRALHWDNYNPREPVTIHASMGGFAIKYAAYFATLARNE